MEITIRTNRLDIVATGSVFVPDGEYAEFIIAGMTFRLTFEQNPGDHASHVTYNVQDEGGNRFMAIHAFNFNNSIVSSVNSVLRLGRIEGRPLSLQMAITTTNRREVEENGVTVVHCNRLVYYTWYLDRLQTNNT